MVDSSISGGIFEKYGEFAGFQSVKPFSVNLKADVGGRIEVTIPCYRWRKPLVKMNPGLASCCV